MKRLIWIAMAALCVAVPALANAADGYVTGNVNLRAGPDHTYPLIATLPAGTPVAVQGCTQGWGWCDVIAYDNRGWIAGNFIQYSDAGQPVLLPSYAARIGIPIVSFVISTYWDAHYRNRPFYRQRQTWYQRPVPHRPPPHPLYKSPRPIHPAAPARPPQRPRPPMTNHAYPARPPQHAQPSRPPQHAQTARPSQHAAPPKPAHGKPAPSSDKNGHDQHHQ